VVAWFEYPRHGVSNPSAGRRHSSLRLGGSTLLVVGFPTLPLVIVVVIGYRSSLRWGGIVVVGVLSCGRVVGGVGMVRSWCFGQPCGLGWGFPHRFVCSPRTDVVGVGMVEVAWSCRYSLCWHWGLTGRRWG